MKSKDAGRTVGGFRAEAPAWRRKEVAILVTVALTLLVSGLG